jgi:hypothetical protein
MEMMVELAGIAMAMVDRPGVAIMDRMLELVGAMAGVGLVMEMVEGVGLWVGVISDENPWNWGLWELRTSKRVLHCRKG